MAIDVYKLYDSFAFVVCFILLRQDLKQSVFAIHKNIKVSGYITWGMLNWSIQHDVSCGTGIMAGHVSRLLR